MIYDVVTLCRDHSGLHHLFGLQTYADNDAQAEHAACAQASIQGWSVLKIYFLRQRPL